MSTTTQPIIYKYTGNGVVATFPFRCHVIRTDDLHVFINNVWKNPNTYTVTGIGDDSGGEVTFLVGHIPANGSIVLVVRFLDYDRTTDYLKDGPFLGDVVNNDQDTQTMQIQQLVEELSRVIQYPLGTDLGHCSDSAYSNKDSCILNGNYWINADGSTTGLGGSGSGGHATSYCTNAQYTDKTSCELHGDHWITNGGYCSNTTYSNEATCEANGGTWTSQEIWCSIPTETTVSECVDAGGTVIYSGAYCSIPAFSESKAICEANNGVWIENSVSNVVPWGVGVPDGIWKWNDTATEVEYIFIEDIVQDVIDALPEPTPESLEYYGWSLAYELTDEYYTDNPKEFSNIIDPTATMIRIEFGSLQTLNSSGIAVQLQRGGAFLVVPHNGTSCEVSGADQSITMQDCEDTFGSLDAGSYIPIAKAPLGPMGGVIQIFPNNRVIVNAIDLEEHLTPDTNIYSAFVDTHTDQVTGFRFISVDDDFKQIEGKPVLKVYQYAKTLTLDIDAIVSGGGTDEQLVADYGNEGTYYDASTSPSAEELIFTLTGSRTKYPTLETGVSVWFIAPWNSSGDPTTGALGGYPAKDILLEDGSDIPLDAFVAGNEYRLYYAVDETWRYIPVAETTVANRSITLAKISLGDPDTYLGFDSEGTPIYKDGTDPSDSPFTNKFTSSGTVYTGGSQEITAAHGLSSGIFGVTAVAECIVDDTNCGYTTGRMISLCTFWAITAERGVTRGIQISHDSTNIYAKVGNGQLLVIGSNGKHAALTPNSWKIYLKAWK